MSPVSGQGTLSWLQSRPQGTGLATEKSVKALSADEQSFSDLEDLLQNRLPIDLCETQLPLRVALFGKPAGPRRLRIDAAHTAIPAPHMQSVIGETPRQTCGSDCVAAPTLAHSHADRCRFSRQPGSSPSILAGTDRIMICAIDFGSSRIRSVFRNPQTPERLTMFSERSEYALLTNTEQHRLTLAAQAVPSRNAIRLWSYSATGPPVSNGSAGFPGLPC